MQNSTNDDKFLRFIVRVFVSCDNKIESFQEVKGFRDTGASVSLIKSDCLKSQNNIKSCGHVKIIGITCNTVEVPLVEINFISTNIKGRFRIGIIDKLPIKDIEMIIGNDIAQHDPIDGLINSEIKQSRNTDKIEYPVKMEKESNKLQEKTMSDDYHTDIAGLDNKNLDDKAMSIVKFSNENSENVSRFENIITSRNPRCEMEFSNEYVGSIPKFENKGVKDGDSSIEISHSDEFVHNKPLFDTIPDEAMTIPEENVIIEEKIESAKNSDIPDEIKKTNEFVCNKPRLEILSQTQITINKKGTAEEDICLLYTSPSPRDA